MTDFVHETAIDLADGADPRAPGGAITVALCCHWDHEPPWAGPDGEVSRWTIRR